MLAEKRTGAIIAIERAIGLRNYIESGIPLEAIITHDLLVTIFQQAAPLHDGAVIIQEDRIAAAACFLPLTVNPQLSRELGSRHRAAIGLTEENDAVAVVVSEESGQDLVCTSTARSSGASAPTCCARGCASCWPRAAPSADSAPGASAAAGKG